MKSSDAVAWAAHGGGGSPSLEVIQNCGDVAMRDVGMVRIGCQLDLMTLNVFFNLNDCMIPIHGVL